MIIKTESVLSKEHCKEILIACEKAGYRKAALRRTERALLRSQGLSEENAVIFTDDGSDLKYDNFYDGSVRGGRTSFPKKEDLPITYPIIENFIHEQNKKFYNANIDSLDLQVAEYNEGQVGFDWHIDDPIYPTDNNLWSGRKITFVFQLSDENDYEGGSLIAIPSMLIPKENFQKSIFNNDNNKHSHKIGHVPNQEVITIINEKNIDIANQQNDTNNIVMGQQNFIISKKIGSYMAFPSFYAHTVTPVISGRRYSLTIWAKGPKWV